MPIPTISLTVVSLVVLMAICFHLDQAYANGQNTNQASKCCYTSYSVIPQFRKSYNHVLAKEL